MRLANLRKHNEGQGVSNIIMSSINICLALPYFVYHLKRLIIILVVNMLLCPLEAHHSRVQQNRTALYPKLVVFCDLFALRQILHSTCVVQRDYQTTRKMKELFLSELAKSSGDARLVYVVVQQFLAEV